MTVLHEGKVPFWCMRYAVSIVLLFIAVYIHWINVGFWETAHLPVPEANIITYFSLKAKCWLRGGIGGQIIWIIILYMFVLFTGFLFGSHNDDARSLPRNAKLKELCLTI